MLSASHTLDQLEDRARDPLNTMRVNTLISGVCRIDLEIVDGVPRWRTNGRTCVRETAVQALTDARAAKSHPFSYHAHTG
jgi:hypothetical protein